MADRDIGQETSAAARQSLLAAYPEHLQHRPAIEAQLAMDVILLRRTVKFLLQHVVEDRDQVQRETVSLCPADIACCIEAANLELDLEAEHAG